MTDAPTKLDAQEDNNGRPSTKIPSGYRKTKKRLYRDRPLYWRWNNDEMARKRQQQYQADV